MDKRIKLLINPIKKYLVKTYGERVKKVILYGSYVRGEETRNSDIDLLVLVDDFLNPFEVRKKLSDLLFDILLEKGAFVSVITVPEHFFERYKSPFMLNVKKKACQYERNNGFYRKSREIFKDSQVCFGYARL